MDPEEAMPEDIDAYFVSFREVKAGADGTHRYYLIRGDAPGRQTLGAVGAPVGGTSGGNAAGREYDYRNARNFTNHGALATRSKRELMTWLDGVVAEGIARQAVESGDTPRAGTSEILHSGDVPGAAAPGHASSAKWVNFSQDKFSFPDGRRGIRFYLVDEHGGATAAVLGEERDTRDGHYTYRKDEEFTRGPPLNCGNLSGVHRWLRDMCAGGAGVLLGTAGSHAPKKGGHKGGNKGGHNGAGGLNARDREHPLDVLGKRRAPSDYFRSAHTGDEDTQATRRLKLEEREVRWHAARRSALAFVREDIHPHTKSEVDKAADLLDKHGVDSEDVNAKGKKNKDRVENATARVIEALRSLSSQYVSLKVMDGTSIVPTVARLKSHPHGTIASMANALCVQWIGSVHNAVGTLAASYERPPPPLPPAGAAGINQASKKPKPVYDDAYVAARRNEPQLRRTRGKEAASLNPTVAGSNPAGIVKAAGSIPAPVIGAAVKQEPKEPKGTSKTSPQLTQKAAKTSPPVTHKQAKISPTQAGHGHGAKETGPGKKKGTQPPTFAPHNPGTPLGKGRKLCLECNGVVGSPTRICPHCNATLPFKQSTANSPHKNTAAAKQKKTEVSTTEGASGGGGSTGQDSSRILQSASVAQFLGRHQERFATCKVSQLKRNVQEVCEGLKAVLDAGRVTDAGAAKHLRDACKKIGEVRLLQGVVERPKARKEVMSLIDAAVKVCNRHGV